MNRTVTTRARLLGTTVLAGVSLMLAAAPALAQDSGTMETVTVTGYRASFADSANAKRASVSFTDSVFAEDIGKFPDTNLAESLNRIPGVTIVREVDGEGLQVQVRGLGTNFTKILLNNANISVASTGRTDSQGQNREVDLNMFPSELFTQLTVSKTPTADQIEGGMAVVNMRTQRPFDNPGMHVSFNLQGTMGSVAGKLGERATAIVSGTEGPFGALLGVSGVHSLVRTTGFETIGWASARLSAAQCEQAVLASSTGTGGGAYTPSTASCQSLNRGGQGWQVPGTWGANTVDAAWLAAQNPDMPRTSRTVTTGSGANTSTYTVYSNDALSNALLPRLGRPADQWGSRDRLNAVLSLEFRPTDNLHFYIDSIAGRLVNKEHRTDMMFQVRNSADVPTQVKVNADGIVTSGVFQNAQMFLEDRPYFEKEDFFSINPGMDWQITDLLDVQLQANASRSHFFRDYPSIGLFTQPTAVTYTNNGGIPTFTTSLDLQDPHAWGWSGARAWIQDEKRYTHTEGVHLDTTYGGDLISVKFGAGYDEVFRNIIPLDNSRAWQAAVCGGNPSIFVNQAPNSDVPCMGAAVSGTQTPGTPIASGFPAYPGLGTGYTSGQTLTWQGPLVPQTDVYKYLVPGKQGYSIVNWPMFRQATDYYQYDAAAPFATGSNTGAKAGTINEQTVSLYAEANGAVHPFGDRALKYNLGLRWIETLQAITGVSRSITDPRNTSLSDGGLYPTTNIFTTVKSTYQAFLPSVNLVYEVTDDFQVRGSISRTMTRPDPSQMLPGATFSDPSAALATVGNSALKPYYSNNIDLGWELYTSPGSYLGMTAFRKSLSGFTVTGVTNHVFSELAAYGIRYADLSATQRGTPSAPTRFTGCTDDASCANVPIQFQQSINSGGLLIVNGLEFTLQQSLDFLTGPYVKGFGISANLTIVDQKGTGAAPAIATGVAPFTYNLTGYYENDYVMVRGQYNYNGMTYSSGSNQNSVCIGGTGCPGGAYLRGAAYGQFDMSASLKLKLLFGDVPADPELTFDVINVFKAKQKTFFQWPSAPFSVYDPGTGFMFGIRGSM